jgi:hypothetical protein
LSQGGVTRALSRLPFRGEVQSLASSRANGRHLLAAADSYGCVTLAAGDDGDEQASLACLVPPAESHEPGWAGIALEGSLAAVARGPARAVRSLAVLDFRHSFEN